MDIPHKKHRSGSPILLGLILLIVIAAIFAISTPHIHRCGNRATMTEAVNNAKQVFYLMIEFDGDYGEFPGDGTAVIHKDENGEPYLDMRAYKGRYSNDYLRQFIVAGYTKSEEIFYVYGASDKKPDNVISSPGKILEAGECGFAYVKNQSTSDNSGRPILISQMTGEGLTFDSDPYDGKAVVLRIDGAVKQLRINKAGEAVVQGTQTLFDTGPGTVWEGEEFDPSQVVFPEPAN